MRALLGNVIEINPTVKVQKGHDIRFVPMDKLEPFRKVPTGYEIRKFSSGSKFINGDTLLARITPCLENGKTAFVNFLEKDERAAGSTEFIVLRAIDGVTDGGYIYYLATSPAFRDFAIKSMIGTSGRQRVQVDLLSNMKINLPPIEKQKKIADILGSLDEKIELNRRMNETLEQIGQALFRHYFIDNPSAKNWQTKEIGEAINIKGGGTPSTKNRDYWGGDIAWTSPRDLANQKCTFLTKTDKTLTRNGLKKVSSGLLPRGTLLLSSRAPIGYVAFADVDLAINQGYIAFLPNSVLPNNFMYFWLKVNMQHIKDAANGSTFLEISKKSFKSIQYKQPDDRTLQEFNSKVCSILEQIKENELQAQVLIAIRDTLLPMLINRG